MADPITFTPEEQTVADLITKIGRAIREVDEKPTLEEIQESLNLAMNVAGGLVQTIEEFNDLVQSYINDNPPHTNSTEVGAIVQNYIDTHNEVPTVEEVKNSLALNVVDGTIAVNYTDDQIRDLISQYLTDNPPEGRSTESINTLIHDYVETHNEVPTVEEIKDSMDLLVADQEVTINYTDDQIRDLISQYLVDNPPEGRSVQDIETIIDSFIDTHNETPTVEEIKTNMGLEENLVPPKPVFNVYSPMIGTFDSVQTAIMNKINAINLTLPNPPAKDIRYIFNKTIPRFAKNWLRDSDLDIDLNVTGVIKYLEESDKFYISDSSNIYVYTTDGALEGTINIGSSFFDITIDAGRIATTDGTVVKIYDKGVSGYQEIQSIDRAYSKVILNTTGYYLIAWSEGTEFDYYKLNRVSGVFELVETVQATGIKSARMLEDSHLFFYYTDSTMYYKGFVSEAWGSETVIILKETVADVDQDYTLSNPITYAYLSIDKYRLLVSDAVDNKVRVFYRKEEGIYALEEEIDVPQIDTGFIVSSYNLARLWVTGGKIYAYTVFDYI